MLMFALRHRQHAISSVHLLRVFCRNISSSKCIDEVGGWCVSSDSKEVVVTGSLSGAKNISKLVPPSNTTASNDSKNNGSLRREARLLVSGPDATGIVASFSQILYGHGCGIVDCTSESSEEDNHDTVIVKDQSVKLQHHGRMFFQRILFDYSNIHVERRVVENDVNSMCRKYGMESHLSWGDKKRRIAIFVSKYDHCLWELLLRHRAGELMCDIALLLSNHEDLRPVAETFNIPYQVFPITKETKSNQEEKQMALLREQKIDLVVLARYMQVLSPEFCNIFHNRLINIHHSFLPAFMGGMPYHRAHERGVKLIGATAHYATMDLDQGPIIEQDIMRVSHRDDVKDLIRKGRTLEKNVLVSAVKAHLEDRIIVHRNKCIVFAE